MTLSLIWSIATFIWFNIIAFISVIYVLTSIMNPYGVKKATPFYNFFNKITSKQEEYGNSCNNVESVDSVENAENVITDEEEVFSSDLKRQAFDERIERLKRELSEKETSNALENNMSYEDKLFEYDEDDIYTPRLHEDTGVEIITEALEMQRERLLK
jgi:hypothetical protein